MWNPKRHLRHKDKPRRRKGNEEKRGKIPITKILQTDQKKPIVETISTDRGKEFAELGAVPNILAESSFTLLFHIIHGKEEQMKIQTGY